MMKRMSAVLSAALLMGSVNGTVFAAEDMNPFDDVPRDHWAYAEVQQLAKDGLVEGFKDGTFRGNDVLTRYEMAAIVGRAVSKLKQQPGNDADYEAVKKLSDEFSHELKSMGVRLSELEKYKSNAGLYGDVRIRYISNKHNRGIDGDGKHGESGLEQRTRLGWRSEITPGFSLNARMRAEHRIGESKVDAAAGDTRYDTTNDVTVDLAQFTWKQGKFQLDGGRLNPTLGQGSIWSAEGDNAMDGALISWSPEKKLTVRAGWASLIQLDDGKQYGDSQYKSQQDRLAQAYLPAIIGDVRYKTGATELTFGYLNTLSEAEDVSLWDYQTADDPWRAKNVYKMNQLAFGFNTQLGSKWKLTGEWITNRGADKLNAGEALADDTKKGLMDANWTKQIDRTNLPDAQRNGYWLGLSYGTLNPSKAHSFQLDATYLKLGNWAVDSTNYPHGLKLRGGDGLGLDGEQGWGIGASYVLSANLVLSGCYYWVSPYDKHASGFNHYKSPWQVALDYRF